MGSYFLNLPMPGLGQSYVAVCDLPCLRQIIITRRPFNQVLSWCLPPSQTPSVVLRTNTREQSLQFWSVQEEQRFCQAPAPVVMPSGELPLNLPPKADIKLPQRRRRRRWEMTN